MSYGNALIDALPAALQKAVAQRLTRVVVRGGKRVMQAGEPIRHVHFPVNAIISAVVETSNGRTVEVGVIGAEGYVETDAALEAAVARRSAICRIPGTVLQIEAGAFRELLRNQPEFLRAIRRATLARIFSTEQLVFCSIHHTIEQRLARWLLDAHDRSKRERQRVTQVELAALLGVRRAGVSAAIARLRKAGAIASEHGATIVADRDCLTAASCECYALIRDAR